MEATCLKMCRGSHFYNSELTSEIFLQYDEFAANYTKEIQQFLDVIKDLDEADMADEIKRKWSV